MLTYMKVKNIALIEEAEITFSPRLNIFSGETGAGKSMLIDAIQFAIGNRSSKQMIRKGQDMATVILDFTDEIGLGVLFLEQNAIKCEDKKIIIEHSIYQSGRTLYKINGSNSTRQMVKQLSAILIDVHGQHEPQSLLDISNHIKLLDSFGDAAFLEKKNEYKTYYSKWQQVKSQISKIGSDDRKKLQLKDLLEFQIQEISACKLKVGEEEELKRQYDMLSHAERIMMQSKRAYSFLDGEGEASALMMVGKAVQALQDISDITPDIHEMYEQFLSIEAEIQDATYQIRRYVEGIEYSPELLIEVQHRLDLIYRLKQKYGNTEQEILDYLKQCEKELLELENGETNKEKLEQEEIRLNKLLNTLSQSLSEERKKIAAKIERSIDEHLHDLQMPYAKFEVCIEELDTFNIDGNNDIEFLIRTNLGEDMHPLSKIASGGEISRVMLAIKTVLFLGDTINTVIFDEIDTGISGLAAQKVAEKLGLIAKDRQILCITHLPQIAAMSDAHYLIEKNASDNKTTTHLNRLDSEQISHELCRLMGGMVTESTLNSADELRERAIRYKADI